jgi:hypothetical protein
VVDEHVADYIGAPVPKRAARHPFVNGGDASTINVNPSLEN